MIGPPGCDRPTLLLPVGAALTGWTLLYCTDPWTLGCMAAGPQSAGCSCGSCFMRRGSWAAQSPPREMRITGHALPDTYTSSDTLRRHPESGPILLCLSHLSRWARHSQLCTHSQDGRVHTGTRRMLMVVCLTHTHVHTPKALGGPGLPGSLWAQTGFWGPWLWNAVPGRPC